MIPRQYYYIGVIVLSPGNGEYPRDSYNAGGAEEGLEYRSEKHRDDGAGEATVVETQPAMQQRNRNDDEGMKHACEHSAEKTISARDGGEAVCEAKSDYNGLRIQLPEAE